MSLATTDLSDAHPEAQVADPVFADFGGRSDFHGPIATVKVFEDNVAVRAVLESAGEGRVLVVDGGGSTRCALLGGQLGELAVANGWAGVIVHGCVRDRTELGAQAVGIRALGAHPRRSAKGMHSAAHDLVVRFASVTFRPGAWLYADLDGIVVADGPIHD